jgi:hypothetical protein
MRGNAWWIAAVLLVPIAGSWARAEDRPVGEAEPSCLLKRVAPVGGWFPYGGGLLHWWDPHWFPCGGSPDLYCHKPLPPFIWHPCTNDYIWGPLRSCSPDKKGP